VNPRILLRAVLGVAASVVALVLVGQGADIPAALGGVLAVDPRWLVLPVAVVIVQLGIRSVRWAVLLTAVGPRRLGARDVVGPLAAGYLGNTVLPARLGEVVRIVLVSRRTGVPATAATASVVVERVVDLIALLAVATVASAMIGATGWLPIAGMLALLGAIGMALPMAAPIADRLPQNLPERARDVLDRFLRAFAAARPPVIVRAWLLSLLAWSCDVLVVWLCAQALGIAVSPGTAALIAAGAAVGAALPAAAGYLGTYELGAMTMAAFAGVSADQALQIALLAHAIAVLPLALVGIISVVVMVIVPPGPTTTHPEVRDVPGSMPGRETAPEPAGR
jgi:glycosyltransferase 2 family protein